MGDDGCWASNEYLATFCQCSIPKVASAVSKLVDLGYIKRESFDGRRRKLKSCLSFFRRQTYKNYKADLKKVDANNTTINQEIIHTPRKSAKTVFTDGFDEFWAVYPKKDAKQAAIKAWNKLKPDDELKQTIINSVRRNIDGKWKDSERRYIPNPANYLNGARWEDESATDTHDEEPVLTLREQLRRGGYYADDE
jgi:DNA-binding Lrp family transcriptional regulator